MSTSGKGKALVSTSGVKTYSKEALDDEIRRLTTTNAQLIANKIKTEKAKINLEADRTRLFNEKNSLIAKKKELRAEIVILNATRPSNVPIRRYQDPFPRPTRDKLKVKRPTPFDSTKKNFQRFFTKTRYY